MGVLQNDEDFVTKNKYSNVNAAAEDREAARSEDTGTIPQSNFASTFESCIAGDSGFNASLSLSRGDR